MTQEKPRRENLLKRALYLSLHRKIKLTFSVENSRLIFFKNFSISVPQLCLENRAPICCTELYGQFSIFVPAQKYVLYGTVLNPYGLYELSYEPRKSCRFCPRKLCRPFSVRLPRFACRFLLYDCLDLHVDFYCTTASICMLYGLSILDKIFSQLSICVQKNCLGIRANSQLRNLPSPPLAQKFSCSIVLSSSSFLLSFHSLVLCLHPQLAFKEWRMSLGLSAALVIFGFPSNPMVEIRLDQGLTLNEKIIHTLIIFPHPL